MNNSQYGLNPNKIYVYLRVSTKSQTMETNGLDNQLKICSDYIYNNFKNISVEYFREIGSSYNDKSKLPILNKMIKKFEPSSLLIVRDISRLGRNTFQVFTLLKNIKKLKSHIISISDNLCYNHSRLMDRDFSHKIIDAEKESDIKNLSLTRRIEEIKKSGGYYGNPPFGTVKIKLNNVPYLYKNHAELDIINLMKKLYKKETNINKVVNYLNSNKIYNRNNKLWTEYAVKNILKKNFPNLLKNPKSNKKSKYLLNILKLKN